MYVVCYADGTALIAHQHAAPKPFGLMESHSGRFLLLFTTDVDDDDDDGDSKGIRFSRSKHVSLTT